MRMPASAGKPAPPHASPICSARARRSRRHPELLTRLQQEKAIEGTDVETLENARRSMHRRGPVWLIYCHSFGCVMLNQLPSPSFMIASMPVEALFGRAGELHPFFFSSSYVFLRIRRPGTRLNRARLSSEGGARPARLLHRASVPVFGSIRTISSSGCALVLPVSHLKPPSIVVALAYLRSRKLVDVKFFRFPADC